MWAFSPICKMIWLTYNYHFYFLSWSTTVIPWGTSFMKVECGWDWEEEYLASPGICVRLSCRAVVLLSHALSEKLWINRAALRPCSVPMSFEQLCGFQGHCWVHSWMGYTRLAIRWRKQIIRAMTLKGPSCSRYIFPGFVIFCFLAAMRWTLHHCSLLTLFTVILPSLQA